MQHHSTTDYRLWLWALGIGIPILAITAAYFWRRLNKSALWRFVFCFLLASLIVPIGFDNGESAAWLFPSLFILAGLFSNRFFSALGAILKLIFPVALVLWGIRSGILFLTSIDWEGDNDKNHDNKKGVNDE